MKTQSKHTPGPWEIERENNEVTRIVAKITNGGGYTIARCYSLKSDTSLMAAAPDLLRLVKQYRQEAISQGADVSDVQEIDKVLRMAGEEI